MESVGAVEGEEGNRISRFLLSGFLQCSQVYVAKEDMHESRPWEEQCQQHELF